MDRRSSLSVPVACLAAALLGALIGGSVTFLSEWIGSVLEKYAEHDASCLGTRDFWRRYSQCRGRSRIRTSGRVEQKLGARSGDWRCAACSDFRRVDSPERLLASCPDYREDVVLGSGHHGGQSGRACWRGAWSKPAVMLE